jgi:hypothetical protein
VVAASVVTAVVVAPLTAYASHSFSDVPNNHPFHDEIGNIHDACITTGFPDGTFRPGNNITRQAEAAFINRAAGRVDEGISATGGTAFGSQWEDVTNAVVRTPGGRSGCSQRVHLTGMVAVRYSDPGACATPGQCELQVGLFRNANPDVQLWVVGVDTASMPNGTEVILPIQRVVTQMGGTTPTYELKVRFLGGAATGSGASWSLPTLTAATFPFDGLGEAP